MNSLIEGAQGLLSQHATLGNALAFPGNRKQRRRLFKLSRGLRYSANLLVDLGNTCQLGVSIISPGFPTSGGAAAASGATIGQSVHMGNADTFCNLHVTGIPAFASGELRIGVQCSDTDTSGDFTDPTSGLQTIPPPFASGGIAYLNSGGLLGGVVGPVVSGNYILSGFSEGFGFQRTGTFVRAVMFGSGFYAGTVVAGFVSQLRTTGSGGGYSYAPGSGVVSV